MMSLTFKGVAPAASEKEDRKDEQEQTTCCGCLNVFMRLFKKRKAAVHETDDVLFGNDAQLEKERKTQKRNS